MIQLDVSKTMMAFIFFCLAITVFGEDASGVVIPNDQISVVDYSDTCHNGDRCVENSIDGYRCPMVGPDGYIWGQYNDLMWDPGVEAYVIYDMGEDRDPTITSVTIWNQGEYGNCERHITGFDISFSDSPDSGFTTVAQPRDYTDCLQTEDHQCTTQTVNGISYEGTPDTITTEVTGSNSARYWKFEVPDECKPSTYFGIMEISFSGFNGPSSSPTVDPTTSSPTANPTTNPTSPPTANPTSTPSANPTSSPTANPTSTPSANPTSSPTADPTSSPTSSPTANPTTNPTSPPTANPTPTPSTNPVPAPTTSLTPDCNDTTWTDGKNGKGCDWVAQSPERRCNKRFSSTNICAHEGCPLTCDNCYGCFDDKTWADAKNGKGCWWIARDPDKRCTKRSSSVADGEVPATDACLFSCENCGA